MVKDKTRMYLNIALVTFGLGLLLFHNLTSLFLFGLTVIITFVVGINRRIK